VQADALCLPRVYVYFPLDLDHRFGSPRGSSSAAQAAPETVGHVESRRSKSGQRTGQQHRQRLTIRGELNQRPNLSPQR
jgi:hypothetical protein